MATDSLACGNHSSYSLRMDIAVANRPLGRGRPQGILLPETAPYASVFLLLACFLILTTHLKQPYLDMGVVSNVQLPFAKGAGCRKGISLDDSHGAVISMNRKHQLSFAIPNLAQAPEPAALTQAGVVKQVAALSGGCLIWSDFYPAAAGGLSNPTFSGG